MKMGRFVWGALLVYGAAIEVEGIVNPDSQDTLSEFTRWAFQVDSTAGAVIFGVLWTAFATWFLVHILGGRKKK
jgi:hypothetical protein